jgi:hypothetical protein
LRKIKTVEVVAAEPPTILSPTKILDPLARVVLVLLLCMILVRMLLAALHTFLGLRVLLDEILSV